MSLKDRYAPLGVELWNIQRCMVRGCLNHGCVVIEPEGVATNGPCYCKPTRLAKSLREIADRIEEIGTMPERKVTKEAFLCDRVSDRVKQLVKRAESTGETWGIWVKWDATDYDVAEGAFYMAPASTHMGESDYYCIWDSKDGVLV